MRSFFFSIILACTLLCSCDSIKVRRIWDKAPHSAFTSLIEYDGYLYCGFREGQNHWDASGETVGTLRVIRSRNGRRWESVATFEKKGYDLRDVSLTVLPTGELAMYCGVSRYFCGTLLSCQSHYSVMKDGKFGELKMVLTDYNSKDQWLWEVVNHKGLMYTIAKGPDDWRLLTSNDGYYFETAHKFKLPFGNDETSIYFDGDQMIVLARTLGDTEAYIGRSFPPYSDDWVWTNCGQAVGGPKILGDIAGGRHYKKTGPQTSIFKVSPSDTLVPVITLPSGGDCSYPGMIIKGKKLYVTYYSSHEDNTAIYFTKIKLNKLK